MAQPENVVPLELHKDLWRPYQFDEDGKVIERPDTMDASAAKPGKALVGDDAARILAEFQQYLEQPK